jgi:hypothetical protein
LAQLSETLDLETFAEASIHLDWDTTMNEEYRYLMENDTWDLVPFPKGRKLVRCKWVYRTKYASDGSVETFAPVAKNEFHPPCSFPCRLT